MADLLDIKDKKLIYHLSLNARTSHSQLAKKVGLSKNAIGYRIERLKKEGIIKKFASVINLGSINLDTFTILLKFNEDIYENKEIIDYFRNHEFCDWVVTLSGDWDILAEIVCKDLSHIQELIKGIVERFSEILNTYHIYFSYDIIKVEHLISDFYKDLQFEPLPSKKRISIKYSIDDTDRKILNILNKDSSMHYLTIAQKLGLTIDIIRYRIKKLVEQGVIIKFFPEISLQKLGYTEYLCLIRLKNLSKDKMDKIRKTIEVNNNITYAFFDIVLFNLVFVCTFNSAEGIDHLLRNLRKEYSAIIENQEYLIIKEQILFNLFPDGLLEI